MSRRAFIGGVGLSVLLRLPEEKAHPVKTRPVKPRSVTASPTTVGGVGRPWGPTVTTTGSATINAAVVIGIGRPRAPVVTGGGAATVNAGVVAGIGLVRAPAVTAGAGASVNAGVVAGIGNVRAPTVTVPGTADFYVATTGNDANNGSSGSPWRTIQHALNVATAGKTIQVAAGAYSPASFVRSGTAGSPITLRASGVVTLTGTGSGAGFAEYGYNYIVIDGFTFVNFLFGIEIDSSASHVTVQNCTFRNNDADGIAIGSGSICSYIDILNNRFEDTTFGPSGSGGGGADQDYGVVVYQSHHISVRGNTFYGNHNQCVSFKENCDDCEALNNQFDGNYYTGIYIGQTPDASPTDKTSTNILVQGNHFRPLDGYRSHDPIVVYNAHGAIATGNFFDSHCDRTSVLTVPVDFTDVGITVGSNTVTPNTVV